MGKRPHKQHNSRGQANSSIRAPVAVAVVAILSVVIFYSGNQAETTPLDAASSAPAGKNTRHKLHPLRNKTYLKLHPEDRDLTHAVERGLLKQLLRLCRKGAIKPSQQIFGVPMLNSLGQYAQDPGATELFLCLIDAGLELNGKATEVTHIAHLPLLLQVIPLTHEEHVIRIIQALVANGADITSAYSLPLGSDSGMTALHGALQLRNVNFEITSEIRSMFKSQGRAETMSTERKKRSVRLQAILRRTLHRTLAEKIDWQKVRAAEESIEQQGKDGQDYRSYSQSDLQLIANVEVSILLQLLLESKQLPELQGAVLRGETVLQDFNGRTPLHHAARAGNALALQMLVEAFPTLLTVEDKSGSQPIALAANAGMVAAVALLEGLGAKRPPVLERTNVSDEGVGKDASGGWGTDVQEAHRLSRCDIDERVNITASEFYHQYLMPGRPVILRGAALDWPARDAWTKPGLLSRYGKLKVSTGATPYAASFGLPERHETLGDFIGRLDPERVSRDGKGNPHYAFTALKGGTGDEHTALMNDYNWRPPFLDHDADGRGWLLSPILHQFFVGGIGQGAAVHFHSNAWNVCVYGERRWFLFPPAIAFYASIPAKQWLENDLPALPTGARPLECMQRAGDVIFVPDMFGHGTYTVRESVGVAVEIAASDTLMKISTSKALDGGFFLGT
jgi:hypothetical protein